MDSEVGRIAVLQVGLFVPQLRHERMKFSVMLLTITHVICMHVYIYIFC